MTSYLSALAARELGSDGVGHSPGLRGRQGVVAPRHVGRYEPWAMPVPESVEREAMSDAPPERNPVAFDARRDDARAVGTDARVEADLLAPVHDSYQPRRAEHDVVASSARRPDVTETRSRTSTSVTSATPMSLAAPVEAARSSTPVSDVIATTRVERTEHETVVSSRRDERAVVAPAQPITPATRAPISPVVTPRRSEARVTAPSTGASAPHDTPPDVVVTIGRIDVRAVSAPAPSRAPRGASPTMSLEDYLRERTRGLR